MTDPNPQLPGRTVLVADDDVQWIDLWKKLLHDCFPQASTIHQTTSLKEAIAIAKEKRPDLILFDDMFSANEFGSRATEEIWSEFPHARIAISSADGSPAATIPLLSYLNEIAPPNAAYGFLSKDNIGSMGRTLVEHLLNGDCWYDAKILRVVTSSASNQTVLSEGEYEALVCLALGLSEAGICEVLKITAGSLAVRQKSLYAKLKINFNRRQESRIDFARRACFVAQQGQVLTLADLVRHAEEVSSHSRKFGVELK
jgi:DNA-binding NarL/FixJ family response regulator